MRVNPSLLIFYMCFLYIRLNSKMKKKHIQFLCKAVSLLKSPIISFHYKYIYISQPVFVEMIFLGANIKNNWYEIG